MSEVDGHQVERTEPPGHPVPTAPERVYDDAEEQLVADRLQALGYIE